MRCAAVDALDPAAVVALARAEAADLVVVGPEAPLGAGVADALEAAGIAVFGPLRAAARMETSKAFCHEVAEAAGVRMARARAFAGGDEDAAAAFVRELAADGTLAVLKADGLAAGKGVIVTDSPEQALALVPSFLAGRPAGEPALVIEERLSGPEASVIAICDGTRAVALPAARDHKRLCDDDRGPNTGGMGAYSPLPDLDDAAVDEVLRDGPPADPRRAGPPWHPVPRLPVRGPHAHGHRPGPARDQRPSRATRRPRRSCRASPGTSRPSSPPPPRARCPQDLGSRLPVRDEAAVTIVLAAEGYPGDPRRGDAIEGIDARSRLGALVFHAGTVARQRPEGGFGTNGGRVLAVTAMGPDVQAARAAAERAADAIAWDGMHRRRDIAAVVPDHPAVLASGQAAPRVPEPAR